MLLIPAVVCKIAYQIRHTNRMAFLIGQFVVGTGKQHIPGATLQQGYLAFDLNGCTGLDDLIFFFLLRSGHNISSPV
jgi:hypothetical protein